jgi:hypothetical protein
LACLEFCRYVFLLVRLDVNSLFFHFP